MGPVIVFPEWEVDVFRCPARYPTAEQQDSLSCLCGYRSSRFGGGRRCASVAGMGQ
jgi:hypothetical protein